MIEAGYVQLMARYNAWQNQATYQAVSELDPPARRADKGLFWDSIEGTLSHMFWGDLIWISRFDGGEGAEASLAQSATAYDWDALWEGRPKLDARIAAWAWGAQAADLDGDLSWYSGAAGKQMTVPRGTCVIQMFNHQTHHRGQIHGALTAAGITTTDTDLPFMPQEVPEWR